MEKLIFILPLLFFGCGDISEKDQEDFPSGDNVVINIIQPTKPPEIVVPKSDPVIIEKVVEKETIQEEPDTDLIIDNDIIEEEPDSDLIIDNDVIEEEPNTESEVDSDFPKTAIPTMPIIEF